jgi:hypothetical protein
MNTAVGIVAGIGIGALIVTPIMAEAAPTTHSTSGQCSSILKDVENGCVIHIKGYKNPFRAYVGYGSYNPPPWIAQFTRVHGNGKCTWVVVASGSKHKLCHN